MDNLIAERPSQPSPVEVAARRVVIAGYFGFGNTGDEAILRVILSDLRRSFPEIEAVVVSGNPEQTMTAHSVNAISHTDIRRILSEIEACDLIILGGGGLFHDYWGVQQDGLLTRSHSGISYYSMFPLLATLLEKPLLLNAIGVGPLASSVSEQYTRMAFEQATVATVRDAESRELLVALGLNGEEIKATADPAFRLEASSPDVARAILKSVGINDSDSPLIGVVLREWNVDVETESWSVEVARALDRMIEEFRATVLFLPFQSVDFELNDDREISTMVRNQMRHGDRTFMIDGDQTPQDKAALLACCQIVLGMRLHSIIFAAKAGVPSVALSYDPKVRSVMRQLAAEEFSFDLKDLDSGALFESMALTIRERVRLGRNVKAAALELAGLAEENHLLTLKLLNGNGYKRKPRSDEAMRFLRQNVLDFIVRSDARDDVLEALTQRMAISEGQSNFQKHELEVMRAIVSARDQGIEWAQKELTIAQEEYRKLTASTDSLKAQVLKEPWKDVQSQSTPVSEQQTEIERLSTKIAHLASVVQAGLTVIEDKQRGLERVTSQALEQHEATANVITNLLTMCQAVVASNNEKQEALTAMELRSAAQEETFRELTKTVLDLSRREEGYAKAHEEDVRLLKTTMTELSHRGEDGAKAAEVERTLSLQRAEVEEHARMVRARDEGITWLRGEVETYQRISQTLASANRVLNEELAEKDAHLQALREAVQTVDLELQGLKISRGWKLLDQFRRARRSMRRLLGRPTFDIPESRPTMLVDRREVEWHANLAPLLEEVHARLAGLWVAMPVASPDIPGRALPDTREKTRLLPTPDETELRMILDQRAIPEKQGRPDVVCFSVIDWEFRYQRPQQMMSQFAAHGHRVFYISTTRFSAPGSAPRVAVKSIKENVIEVQLCSVHQPDVYGEVIGGINRGELEAALAELRSTYSIDEAISYVMIASWTELARMTQEKWGWRVIYDCMDEWDRFPGIRPVIVEAEKRLVENCDLLVVSSRCLEKKWSAHAEKLTLARNAVDYEFYLSRFGPSHLLADAKRPIVGYFGAIADWFDLELLAFLARNRPDYTFVLLGGIFGVDVSELIKMPNVRFLGQHPYELMPKYLYQFDVSIIPFKMNPITEATDPVKLYEYLSSGKPVVSVNLPELEPYRDHVYLAKDQDEFIEFLDRALTEHDRDKAEGRRALARANEWSSRYQAVMTGVVARTPKVSIIVITYNNLELTKLCLESILVNTEYPNYEVIVVDNNSTDGTPSYLEFMADRFSQIRILLNRTNEGFARANNQGIEISTGEDLVLLNNDTVVSPGWLSRLVRHLRHPEVGLVGPVSNFVGNEARIEVTYETCKEMEAFAKHHTSTHDGQAADINMLAMFCVAMRREVARDVGPLDEQFGLGMFEDDDYAHRMRLKGYRVICAADVFVHHFGQASFKKLIATGEYDVIFKRNLEAFEKKWGVKWSARSNVPLDFKRDYVGKANGTSRNSANLKPRE